MTPGDDGLRVATAGAGYFSRYHYDAWSRIPRAQLVGLAVRTDRDRAARTAAAYGVPESFLDVEKMLDAVRPDLLDIITPPDSHLELVRLAAARGIAVICQKPLAPTLDEAVELVETAEASGSLLVVHENWRFKPWFREARRLLAAGRLGDPYAVSFRMRPGDGQGPRAYLDRQPYFQTMPRFLVHETGIHLVDTFRSLMGEVSGVFARLRRLNPVIAGEDAGQVLFEFGNEVTGLLDGNRLADFPADNARLTMGEMLVEGSAGRLRLDGHGHLWWKAFGEARESEHSYEWQARGYGGDAVHALQKHVVEHLLDGASIENTGRGYLRNLEIEQAIYRSHEEMRWIDTPLPAA